MAVTSAGHEQTSREGVLLSSPAMANPRLLPWMLLLLTTTACPGDDGTADTTLVTTDDPGTSTASSTSGPPPTSSTTVDDPTVAPTTTGELPGTSTAPDPDTSSGSSSEGSTTAGVVSASATLEPKSGSNAMGTAVFTDAGDGTADLMVEAMGVLPPGTHALHIHEFPDCSAEDATSAGMHWNPAGTMLGELGTVEIANDGSGVFTKSDAWSIGTGRDNDVVGRSIVIHADPDGGTRIACGVITLD